MLAMLLPISVSAGILSQIGTLFSKQEKVESLEYNLSNMPLLSAATSPLAFNPKINIVEDSAIAPFESSSVSTSTVHKSTTDQISVYVVRDGDTLSQIAEMFGVSANTIRWGNDLTSNTLKTGQTLVILPITGIRHKVEKGDTLASIAKKYKADIDEIVAYNDLTLGSSLTVGFEVIVPDGELQAISKPSSSSSSVGSSSASGLKEYSGYYMRPISGGKRSQGIHGYNAVDLAAPVGTSVYAAADGEVIISRSAGWNGGYGTYIVIKHANGTQTLYAHNNENLVSVGDSVTQGQVIAKVGKTGKVTGAHLHFEIRGAKNPF